MASILVGRLWLAVFGCFAGILLVLVAAPARADDPTATSALARAAGDAPTPNPPPGRTIASAESPQSPTPAPAPPEVRVLGSVAAAAQPVVDLHPASVRHSTVLRRAAVHQPAVAASSPRFGESLLMSGLGGFGIAAFGLVSLGLRRRLW
jgi:hypothetical protein